MEKYDNQSYFLNLSRQPYSTLCGKTVVMIGTNKKTGNFYVVECVETCKQGLVLLVGGLTVEEQNKVATSLTVTCVT